LGNATGVSLIDPEGNVLHSRSRAIDTMLVLIGLKKYTDNEFFFTSAYMKDTCANSGNSVTQRIYPVIGRMDSLGNILSAKYYDANTSGCTNIVGDLEVTVNKSVITWGNNYAVKVDSMGLPMWSKLINANCKFRFIKELPSGDLLAGFNMDTAGVVIARLDQDGNFLWCKSYIRPRGVVHDVVLGPDDTYIITGTTDHSSASLNSPLAAAFQPKLFMLKLNGQGEVQWCRGYDSSPDHWHTPRTSKIRKTQNGNYAILATLGQPGLNMFSRPFLMLTDQNGDTLWTRSMGANNYTYYSMELMTASDGGFALSGVVHGNLPEGYTGAPYVLKTDSLGHVPCLERYHPVQLLDLFPTDSSFTLSSTDGTTMHQAFVSEVDDDPIAVHDACLVTGGSPATPSGAFSIRPNPNTGHFTVVFADPLLAESYYSVYDALGKLLVQRPLPAGSTTEQVDLSRYGTGTYVIKFTSPEGVQHERVVVE
jgi:hypothetical protein